MPTRRMLKLTKTKKRAYLKDSGHCPYCGHDEFDHGDLEMEGAPPEITQRVDCLGCGRFWFDEYKLSGIIEGVDLP